MDLIEEINRYVNSKEHSGVLLITGKWGCGKSYQINQFKEKVKDKKIVIVISLFGVENRNDIERVIKDKLFDELYFANVDGEVKNIARKYTKVLSIFSKRMRKLSTNITVGKYDLINIKKNIEKIGSDTTKELILVFDDFERSKMDTVNLLGLINDYCENKNIKVIIVTNEEKVIHNYNEKDNNSKNSEYEEFKEKVVQSTIHVESDYESIISNIVSLYDASIDGYKNFLESNITNLHQVFIESKYNNLRTVKTVLIGFERVYRIYNNKFKNKLILNYLLYSYAAMMFEMKYGNFKINKYGYLMSDQGLEKKYSFYNRYGSALGSLKQYVYTNSLDNNQFEFEVQHKYFKYKERPEEKFLYSDFWDLNSNIINEGLPVCLDLAYKGDLHLDEYVTLLNHSATLKDMGMNLPCKIDFHKMKSGLNILQDKFIEGKVSIYSKRTYVEDNRIKILGEDAISFNRALEKLNDKISGIMNKKKALDSLNTDCNFAGQYNVSVDSFDEKFREILYGSFKKAENIVKRDISLWFSKLQFDNRYCTDDADIKLTIKNLDILKEDMQQLINEETDDFTNLINRGFLTEIETMKNKLEESTF